MPQIVFWTSNTDRSIVQQMTHFGNITAVLLHITVNLLVCNKGDKAHTSDHKWKTTQATKPSSEDKLKTVWGKTDKEGGTSNGLALQIYLFTYEPDKENKRNPKTKTNHWK